MYKKNKVNPFARTEDCDTAIQNVIAPKFENSVRNPKEAMSWLSMDSQNNCSTAFRLTRKAADVGLLPQIAPGFNRENIEYGTRATPDLLFSFISPGKIQKQHDYSIAEQIQEPEQNNVSNELIVNNYGRKISIDTSTPFQIENDAARNICNQRLAISWDDRLHMLQKFKEEHGHCRVPQKHPELGAWVKWQREKYALLQKGISCSLTEQEIDSLNRLDFTWRIRNKRVEKPRIIDAVGKTEVTESDKKTSKNCDKVMPSKNIKKRKNSAESYERGGNLTDESDSIYTSTQRSIPKPRANDTETLGGTTMSREVMSKPSLAIDSSAILNIDRGNYMAAQLPVANQIYEIDESKKQMELEMTCKMCAGIMVEYSVCVPCGHAFCKSCVSLIYSRLNSSCPCCRVEVSDSIQVKQVDRMILNMVKQGYFDDNSASHYLVRKLYKKDARVSATEETDTSIISPHNYFIP